MALILERDEATCVWCRRPLGPADPTGRIEVTTEHVVPRIKGGPSWVENEVAACKRCNGRRGHRTPADWADECEGLGWSPDRARIAHALRRLEARIAEVGGQRRARPYVRSQLRRFADH